jgi:hypothetical protein
MATPTTTPTTTTGPTGNGIAPGGITDGEGGGSPVAAPKLDQSFWVYLINYSDLKPIEQRIAEYSLSLFDSPASGVATWYEGTPYPSGGMNSIAAPTGERPVRSDEIRGDYPSTVAPESEPVIVVETSEYIELTQRDHPGPAHRYRVPSTTHLLVYGDVVCIHGKISVPGKHIVIFARELRSLADGSIPAELDVGLLSEQAPKTADVPDFPNPAAPGPEGPSAKHTQMWSPNKFAGSYNWHKIGEYRSGGTLYTSSPDTPAGPGEPGHTGADGAHGNPGSAGGDLFIVCDSVAEGTQLTLDCSGGHGGRGQNGQEGGKGGRGGAGANEKKVHEGVSAADYVYAALPGCSVGGWGGDGGAPGPPGPAGPSGNCTLIVNGPLPASSDTGLVRIDLKAKPGKPGQWGNGGNPGKIGDAGLDGVGPNGFPPETNTTGGGKTRSGTGPKQGARKPGQMEPPPARWGRYFRIHNLSLPRGRDTDGPAAVPAPPPVPTSTYIHRNPLYRPSPTSGRPHGPSVSGDPAKLKGVAKVGHLRLLLATARAQYIRWDTYRWAGDLDADGLKDELRARLDFLAFAQELLPEFPSDEDEKLAAGLRTARSALAYRLAHEWDYFGNPRDYVEVGSPDFFLTRFEAAVKTLGEREPIYLQYLQSFAWTQDLYRRRETALRHAGTAIRGHDGTLELLKKSLNDLKDQLKAADDGPILRTRDALIRALAGLEQEIWNHPGLTAADLADALFNMAFAGNPFGGSREGGNLGKFTTFTTVVSQSARLIDKAINTLPNDDGQAVSRQHVLMKVETFNKKLSKLDEAWSVIQQVQNPQAPGEIALKDKDAYRLIVAQDDLEKLLEQFYTNPKAQQAMGAMNDYVEAVQARNEILAQYNVLVAEYLNVAGERQALQGTKKAVEDIWARDMAPNLYSETAFVTALYDRTREECITLCYDALRAFRFWSLKPDTDNALYQTLKLGDSNQIDHNVLSAAKGTLFSGRTNTIKGAMTQLVQPFPDPKLDLKGRGIVVVFKEADYPLQFARLKKDGVASFDIPVATRQSTKATNPFAGYYNVRITIARAWIRGVSSDDHMCFVNLQHGGEEKIVRKEDGVVIAMSHKPVDFKFVYNYEAVQWDPTGCFVQNPADALQLGGTDGGIMLPAEYAGSTYLPLIGPFTRWEIKLDPDKHIGLDRSKINAICMDFHGFSQ